MHRHGARILRPRSTTTFYQARRASTATRLKPREDAELLGEALPSPRDHSPQALKLGNGSEHSYRREPLSTTSSPKPKSMGWDPHSGPSLSSLTSARVAPSTPTQPFNPRTNRSVQDAPKNNSYHRRRVEERSPVRGLTHSQSVHRTHGIESETSRRDPGGPRRQTYKERGSSLQPPSQSPNQRPSRSPVNDFKYDEKKHKSKRKALNTTRQTPLKVYIPTTVSVGNLATILKVRIERLQRRIAALGLTESPTHDYVLTSDYATLLAEEFDRQPVVDDDAAFDLFPPKPRSDPTTLPLRPPVVTIMGHVDHGKTTLLDTLRSTSVAKGEAGGITQHIGAFSVPVKTESSESSSLKSITFLDTPGHAAFSAMRARGAGVTDIIVLVVAADDGIMPQTREVIELYKKYQDTVGLVVAINKVDKPAADVESVEKALMAEGIQLESYGGDIPAVYVSGLTGQGLPDLVETLAALAEMQDLRAEQTGFAFGEILESKVQRGLGFVATALVLEGSLRTGSHIVSGLHYAKVRRMTDSTGKVVSVATPGMAVTVSGWKTLPKAGDSVIEGAEPDVKKALANRIRQSEIEASLADVDAINETRRVERELRAAEVNNKQVNSRSKVQMDESSGPKELKIIIKADVSGSAEAVEGALQGIGNKIAISKVISTGVGEVSETDITLAGTADAMIVAFSVSVPRSIQHLAMRNGVQISSSDIIYKLMDDVRNRVRALLPPIIETTVTGEANVLQLFDIQNKDKSTKKVAGCRVSNGLIEKSKHARVIRSGETVYEGSLDTLKQLKKDVTEVRKGTECGLSFEGFSDLKEGDLIQTFERIEKPGLL